MIDKIRTYIATCPYLDQNGAIGVDYLGNSIINYSIEQIPVEPIVKRFVDGSKLKQLAFVFASREAWSADVITNLLNCKFYDDFSKWIEENNDSGILPEIDGIESIECKSTGYAYQVSETEARYQIQMLVLYKVK
jgi:hypothetical protein